ncbi:MAG TPA: hypothetical protein VF044_02920 [Actinomycetota bacterium]
MGQGKITYAGVGGAVAGLIGLLGVFLNWWESGDTGFQGTSDVSGTFGLAMAIATFAFGGAYLLMSDPRVRRSMGALMTLAAVLLTLAAVWGVTRADQVAADASAAAGLWISGIGGILGIGAGFLAMRDAQTMDAAGRGVGA